jgi:uncharacterized RDD family membrane protein YckC
MSEENSVPIGLTTDGLLVRRYLARFIDSVFILLLITILSVLTGAHDPFPASYLFPISLFVWIGWMTVFESSPWQATIGKKIVGLRVYDSQGGRLSWRRAAIRSVVKDGPFLVLGFLPNRQLTTLLWLGVHLTVLYSSPVSQAIHDRVAHTWVAAPEETTQLRLS